MIGHKKTLKPWVRKVMACISTPKPAVRSGWSLPRIYRGTHEKRFKLTTTFPASVFSRTSGCAVVRCDAGYRRVSQAGPFTHLKRAAAPECLNRARSEEHTSELQSRLHLVCRLLLEKKNC